MIRCIVVSLINWVVVVWVFAVVYRLRLNPPDKIDYVRAVIVHIVVSEEPEPSAYRDPEDQRGDEDPDLRPQRPENVGQADLVLGLNFFLHSSLLK